MAIGIDDVKAFGKKAWKGVNHAADQGGSWISKGLQKTIVEDAVTADRMGKYAMYGAMGLGVVGNVTNLDEYQYGIGNGIVQQTTGSISGAGLGAVAGAGIGAVAAAIAKGIR